MTCSDSHSDAIYVPCVPYVQALHVTVFSFARPAIHIFTFPQLDANVCYYSCGFVSRATQSKLQERECMKSDSPYLL